MLMDFHNYQLDQISVLIKQNHGDINVIELVHEEKLDDLPVKASDIATATSKDPILKQVKHFVLKGWPR